MSRRCRKRQRSLTHEAVGLAHLSAAVPLEECARVVDSTAKSEAACREALGSVRADQASIRAQLDKCHEFQRAAAPREQLERRLRVALRDAGEARARRQPRQACIFCSIS